MLRRHGGIHTGRDTTSPDRASRAYSARSDCINPRACYPFTQLDVRTRALCITVSSTQGPNSQPETTMTPEECLAKIQEIAAALGRDVADNIAKMDSRIAEIEKKADAII